MSIFAKTSVFLICLTNVMMGQEAESPAYLGVKNILLGNFNESVNSLSAAIKLDSAGFENYYFRGVARAWLSDTVNCIADFFKAVDLKAKYTHSQTDTLIAQWTASKPTRNPTICAQTLDHQSDEFFEIWLGTWYLLNTTDTKKGCESFKYAEEHGVTQLKPYKLKYCK